MYLSLSIVIYLSFSLSLSLSLSLYIYICVFGCIYLSIYKTLRSSFTTTAELMMLKTVISNEEIIVYFSLFLAIFNKVFFYNYSVIIQLMTTPFSSSDHHCLLRVYFIKPSPSSSIANQCIILCHVVCCYRFVSRLPWLAAVCVNTCEK